MRYRKSDAMELGSDKADGVIAAFEDALIGATDHGELLRVWIARYPALASDLSMAAGGFNDVSSDEALANQGGVARYASIAVALIDEVLASRPIAPASHVVKIDLPVTLDDAARRVGIAYPNQLAARLRIPEALLRHLQRGHIDLRTIPSTFAQELADLLKLTFADTARLLRGPTSASGLVLEEKTPYGGTQSFDALLAVEAAPGDQAYWSDRSRFSAMLE